jgi:LmbE family N-acetylglucosaminyl deacetylase
VIKAPADILVIMPHPDDSEFGCAGTIAKWTKEGKSVVYVIITNGDKGTSDRTLTPEKLSVIRQAEQRDAARVLGVEDVVFLGYPDQGLEDSPDLRKSVVRQIRTYRPSVIVTLDPYRRYIWHRDHRIAGQVVLDAVYPYSRDHLAYPDMLDEGLEPHKVKEIYLTASEDPDYYADITDTFEQKMQALACHKSQVGEGIDELREGLLRRAKDMAKGKKFKLAEAFHYIDLEMLGPYRKNDKK